MAALSVATLVAAGTAGCGGSGSSPDATVHTFMKALLDGDGKTVCGLLDSRAIKKFETGLTTCPQTVRVVSQDVSGPQRERAKHLQLSVAIHGHRATVTTQGSKQPLVLVKRDGKWYIDGGLSG